ncbi:hypothetical protein G6011_11638 [Alternaria panax]|uniref:Methylsterol monooxygenase n=1 Tax=Alternaria panax TaxID=48097 RepID=A0AAD4IE63_9PLEO|nr:hypothetical protein G6011_11638 [Alternaria panax]
MGSASKAEELPPIAPHARLSIVLAFVLTSTSTVVVALRFYARHFYVGRLTSSDWVMLSALIATWLSVVVHCYMIHFLDYSSTTFGVWETFRPIIVGSNLSIWLYRINFILDLCLIKTSILLFYAHIASSNKRFQYVVRGLLAIIVLGGISQIIASILMCTPITNAFSYDVWYKGFILHIFDAHCYNPNPFWLFIAVYNLTTDVIIWTLPILFFLNASTLPLRHRLELAAIFSVGIIAIISSAFRLHTTILWLSSIEQQSASTPDLLLWSQVEQNLGIIAASVPFLRPLLRKAFCRSRGRDQLSPGPGLPLVENDTPEFNPAMFRTPIIPSPSPTFDRCSREFRPPRCTLEPIQPIKSMSSWGSEIWDGSQIVPAQSVFWNEEASSLLTEVFDAFKTIQGLKQICFGAEERINKPLLGLRRLLKDIGFCNVGSRMAQCCIRKSIGETCIDTYIPAAYTHFLHEALSNSSFDKRIVHLNIRNRTGNGRHSLPNAWAYAGHLSMLNLNVQDKAHIPSPATTMTLSTTNNATSLLMPMAQDTYWSTFEEISTYNVQLNYLEKMWMAWYAWMNNDVLATGIMSFVIHEALYFGRSLPWIIIDCIPYFNRYKLQNQKIPTAWEQTQCALLVLLSHFTVELPQIWLFHPMCQYFGLETSVPFPSMYKMAYQIAIFFVLEDAWHYWTHRAMHASSFLYKNVHKIHHQYSAPFGLAAEYASPIEVMVLGFGTVGVPIVFCAITKDLHILTMYTWIVFRLFQAIDAHSGYEFPWSLHHFLPFWAGAEHHDVHHEKFIGNYASSFRWWDFVLDTEAGAEASKKRRERKLAAAKAKKAM